MTKLYYQGHGSYRLTLNNGTVVYVDPSLGDGYNVPADLVVVTHDHPDHNKVNKMPRKRSCRVILPSEFLEGGEHQVIEACGIKMTAVQACNKFHPIDQCVGIVMEFDGLKFYAAGDTSTTDDMRSGKLAAMGLDYATFPADGFYNMDIEEASECARLVNAKNSIPMHLVPVHDINDAILFDEKKAEAFNGPGKLVLRPGDDITLQESEPRPEIPAEFWSMLG